jgi:uncharacterized membrane protein
LFQQAGREPSEADAKWKLGFVYVKVAGPSAMRVFEIERRDGLNFVVSASAIQSGLPMAALRTELGVINAIPVPS